MASGRGRREDQWRNALPLTGRRSRRRNPGILCHQASRSPGGVGIFKKSNETIRPAEGHRNGSTEVISGGNDGHWQSSRPGSRSMGKTIALRIPISHFGDESVPCPVSYSNEVCRNSQPFVLPSAITSTFKDILSKETNLQFTAMLHLSDGTSFGLHNPGKPETT